MKVNYLLEGSGDKTIVFIHGLSDSLNYWLKLSSHLTDEYKILLYDIRGHGKSELGSKAFTIDMLVNDLYGLLLRLGIKKAGFAGLSLGGNIALSFAVTHPEMAEKLIIMSSFSEVDENLKFRFEEFRKAIDISYEEFYDVIIKYVLPSDILNKNKEALEMIKHENAKSANLKAIRNGIDMGVNFNITDELKCINCPALILTGQDDDIVTLELSKILDDNINNSELIIFENTKHDLLIGRNISEILNLIRKFI